MRWSALLLVSLFGCRDIEPAPEDLDGLAHYLWQHMDDDTPEALAEGIVNLHAAMGADALAEVQDGSLSALDGEEVALVGKDASGADALAGIYILDVVHCGVAELEAQTYATDQDVLHPGTYVSYDRVYTSDLQAYQARQTEWLRWVSTYEVEGFGANYSASIDGSMRYLDALATEGATPAGPAFLSRGVLVEAAWFDDDGDRGIYQDYQLEVYWERAPAETVHVYVIWREMVYLGSADFNSEAVQGFVIDGLLDWDADAEVLCGASD